MLRGWLFATMDCLLYISCFAGACLQRWVIYYIFIILRGLSFVIMGYLLYIRHASSLIVNGNELSTIYIILSRLFNIGLVANGNGLSTIYIVLPRLFNIGLVANGNGLSTIYIVLLRINTAIVKLVANGNGLFIIYIITLKQTP
jgi:hypothetical protein